MSLPTFTITLEQTDAGPSWWAVSDEVPGLSVAAPTLPEMKERLRDALAEIRGDARFCEVLGDATILHGPNGEQCRIATVASPVPGAGPGVEE